MKFCEWIEFFADKRFGWRFKIANFIMGDYLRNYLAVGCLCSLSDIIDLESDDPLMRFAKKLAKRAKKSVTEVMEM